MTDHNAVQEGPADQSDDLHDEGADQRQLPLLLFGLTTIGFLVYLAIGSIETRIWRFGRLNFEDRTIREVWAYFGDRLPEMPGQPVITALYWMSVAIMVIGTVVGLWLFLGTDDESPSSASSSVDRETTSTHV